MSTISTGRNSGDGQPPHDVDAHNANQRDSDRGLAGVEAKPFADAAKRAQAEVADAEESDAASQENLISARRNAGRD
ncbi:hypothetical protein [Novosphingobium gossypii]|uniref:hypothetical protein n=1 Tax=Novosphingobium gossypii TaxID=1604774 RepID=UPI003D1D95AB